MEIKGPLIVVFWKFSKWKNFSLWCFWKVSKNQHFHKITNKELAILSKVIWLVLKFMKLYLCIKSILRLSLLMWLYIETIFIFFENLNFILIYLYIYMKNIGYPTPFLIIAQHWFELAKKGVDPIAKWDACLYIYI